MKSLFKVVMVAMFLFAATTFAVAKDAIDVYDLDPVHSSAGFTVRHMGISNVKGMFTDISGTINLDRTNVSKSAVKIIIKTASVETHNDKRNEHLKTADFFDVATFPEMTFVSVSVKKAGKDDLNVTGDFTLHGVTKRLTIKASKVGEGKDDKGVSRIGYDADFSIKRSDYGMGKMIPLVGDKISISLSVEADKKAE